MVALAVRRVKATETSCLTHVTGFLRFFPAILFFATIVVLQISDRFLLLFQHRSRVFCSNSSNFSCLVERIGLANTFFLAWKNFNEFSPIKIIKKLSTRLSNFYPFLYKILFFYTIISIQRKEENHCDPTIAGVRSPRTIRIKRQDKQKSLYIAREGVVE